jgi:hypothetical protein
MGNNYCVGCSCYYEDKGGYYYCNLEIGNDVGQCPCTRCVVKVMCERACPDFNKFKETVGVKGLIRHELQRPL